jgi:hypothetical protein
MMNLDKVLHKYRMNITAIQEISWLGQGISERRDCDTCYSCQKNNYEFGCGFVANKKSQTSCNGLHTNRSQDMCS